MLEFFDHHFFYFLAVPICGHDMLCNHQKWRVVVVEEEEEALVASVTGHQYLIPILTFRNL